MVAKFASWVRGGDERAPGETGELWLKGECMMEGYVNNPAATAACLKDGWLMTGDLVSRDEEGFISVVGRIKEMISFAGHSVAPSELVETLIAHPEVAEATVAGLPSDEWGEVPLAFVVREGGSKLSAGDLLEHCRSKLSEYKVPRDVVFVKELARTHTGKVMNATMIRQYQDLETVREGNIDERILTIAQACFRTAVRPGPGASPATESGWDSLAHMEMLIQIEKEFDIRFSTRQIMILEDLGSIIKLVTQKCAR